MDQTEITRAAHFLLATRGRGAFFDAKRSAHRLRNRRLEGTASEWDTIAATIVKIEASVFPDASDGPAQTR